MKLIPPVRLFFIGQAIASFLVLSHAHAMEADVAYDGSIKLVMQDGREWQWGVGFYDWSAGGMGKTQKSFTPLASGDGVEYAGTWGDVEGKFSGNRTFTTDGSTVVIEERWETDSVSPVELGFLLVGQFDLEKDQKMDVEWSGNEGPAGLEFSRLGLGERLRVSWPEVHSVTYHLREGGFRISFEGDVLPNMVVNNVSKVESGETQVTMRFMVSRDRVAESGSLKVTISPMK